MSGIRSDEDRNRAADELREHYAQGRLDVDELGERLERIYAARTSRELEALRADLPAPTPMGNPRRSELAREFVQQTGGRDGRGLPRPPYLPSARRESPVQGSPPAPARPTTSVNGHGESLRVPQL